MIVGIFTLTVRFSQTDLNSCVCHLRISEEKIFIKYFRHSTFVVHVRRPRSDASRSVVVQRKAPLAAIRVVAPPMRHKHDFASSEEQENEQHAEVEAGVESCSQDIVPSRPKGVAVAVHPEHDHEAADETAQLAGAYVSVEVRHRAEKDGRVEKMELGAREEAVEGVNQDWGDGA
jgi:hypothetical protein